MAGPIKIAILANAKPAISGMKNVEQAANGMGSKVGSVGKGMAKGFAMMGTAMAAVGLAEGFKEVIGQAADLSAAVGATKQVFGTASAGMLDWSKTTATTLGLSQSEALNATKVFGGFFTAVGMGSKEAAGMSQSWATMAGNLAAFADLPTADAIDAITGALRGEMDPLQKYIPTVSAAAVQQKAMELSGKKNAKALTQQDKAAALNALMMDSVANKAGKAERAQGGYAVQMEKLKAQGKDAAAAIGGVFLPALTKGMGYINDTAIPAVKKFGEFIGPKLKGLLGNIGGFKPPKAIVDIAQSKEAASIFTNLKTGVMSLAPMFTKARAVIMPIVTAIGGTLGKAFGKALPQIKATIGTIGQIVGQAFAIIKAQISNAVAVIQFIWQNFGANILAYVSSAFAGVVTVIQGVFNVIKGIFNVVIGLLTGDWSKAWEGVKGIVTGAVQVLRGLFGVIRAQVVLLGSIIGKTLSAAWNAVKIVATAAWNSIKAMLLSVWNGIKAVIASAVAGIASLLASAWNGIKSATSAAWNAVKAVTAAVWNGIKSFFSGWWAGVRGLAASGGAAIRGAITAAWNAVKSATVAAWNGIKGAVVSGIGTVVSTVKALPGKIKSAVGNAGGWLVNVGRDMIRGLISGIGSMADAVLDKVRSVIGNAVPFAKSLLGEKSPSKVFMEIGANIVAGLVDGMETGKDDIKRTTEGLIANVIKAFPTSVKKVFPKGTKLSVIEKWKKAEIAAGKTRAKKKSALIARIEKDNAKLLSLADQRDAAAEGLKAANQRLEDLQKAREGVVSSVASTFENSFKLINDSGEEGIASIEDLLQRSRDSVAQSQTFADQIKSLATKGVAPEILQELAMAGPAAAMDTAKALVDASADQLKELNANYKLIAASGQAAGETVASNMYDSGIAAAQSLADGFRSQQVYLEASILEIIDSLNRAISSAIAAVTPKTPTVVVKKPATTPVKKPAPAKKGTTTPAKKAAPKKAVPAVTTGSTTVTINTGVVVDKRGMVDAISSAFNEVSGALGRPITMNVKA